MKKITKDSMSPEHTLMCHCGCQSPQTLPMLLIFKTNLLIEVLTAFKLSLQGDCVLINPQKQSMMYLFQVSGWLEYENEEHNGADVLKSQQTAISDMGTSCLSLQIKPLNRELHLRSHYTDGSANDLKRGRCSINFDLQARFLTSCMCVTSTKRCLEQGGTILCKQSGFCRWWVSLIVYFIIIFTYIHFYLDFFLLIIILLSSWFGCWHLLPLFALGLEAACGFREKLRRGNGEAEWDIQ